MVAAPAYAPGTLDTTDLIQLLKQRPEVSKPFLEAFELERVASGARLGSHFTHLSGARIGPYQVMARPKGSKGPFNIEVWVCTGTEFLDKAGKRTDDEFSASRTREYLDGFIVQPQDGKLRCME